MKFISTTQLTTTWKKEILILWNNEYPSKLNYNSLQDFENYLETLADQSHIIIIDESQKVRGWYVDFTRDKEKWFAVIFDSKTQGQGLGTKLLDLAKEKETELSGWVIDHNTDIKRNGEYYKSPIGFYLKNGFRILEENRLEDEKISAVKINWKHTN